MVKPADRRDGVLLDALVWPWYAQVEISDRDNADIPQWETGEESVVYNQTAILVATRPDVRGHVRVLVIDGDDPETPGYEVFSGTILLPSGVLSVGSSHGHLDYLDMGERRALSLRILVDPQENPDTVRVLIRCSDDATST